jgi:hypothetical protein
MGAEIAYVLDVAEYLPMLMLEERDRTREFRDQLESTGNEIPKFQCGSGL